MNDKCKMQNGNRGKRIPSPHFPFSIFHFPSPPRRRGAVAVLAMLFLVILATLTTAVYSVATLNVQSGSNLADVARARSAAESGLRWFTYRLLKMDRPHTTVGRIDAKTAAALWPNITSALSADFTTKHPINAAMKTDAGDDLLTVSGATATTARFVADGYGASFQIIFAQHPLDASDALDARYLRVISTGYYGNTQRSCHMDFKIDKKVKFAVVGKVPIQLGRNVLVEGSIAMATTLQPSGQPPILSLSDFKNLKSDLTSQINSFQTFLKNNYSGFDNRVSVNDPAYKKATNAGFSDVNKDGYIDEYDLFVKEFSSADGGYHAVTASDFTNPMTGQLYDDSLLTAIDNLGAPLYTGQSLRDGYQDTVVDDRDGYAKVRGQVLIAESVDHLADRLADSGKSISDVIQGPIIPQNPGDTPVKFSAGQNDVFDLSPENFKDCADGFAAKSGANAGTASRTTKAISNTTLQPSDANGGSVTEHTPYGSTSYQATYKRPVFKNMTFTNVVIPKGMNALFQNCTFKGVTFVETEQNIVDPNTNKTTTNKDGGKRWAEDKISGSSFSTNTVLISSGRPQSGQTITEGSQNGNNLRFDSCTFNGPIAGNYATAYTHFANSWEFTGTTNIDLSALPAAQQTATIVSPQVNIEMGSFTQPGQNPSTLVGVVVVGNIDIRGAGIVDGSIIITGDGAGNTTLGWFGKSDGDTDTTAPMPEGGFGRLNLRYNPYRALPDGIDLPIDILPDPTTYAEGAQ